MSTIYRFLLGADVELGPNQGRNLAARLLSEAPQVHSLFNYRADGNPVTGDPQRAAQLRAAGADGATRSAASRRAAYPKVRWHAGGQTIQVTALTDEASELLDAHAAILARALKKVLGTAPQMTRHEEYCAIVPSDRLYFYAVHGMLVARKDKTLRRFLAATRDEQLAMTRKRIVDGLLVQADLLDVDMPVSEGHLGMLQFDEAFPYKAVIDSAGINRQGAIMLRRLRFAAPFKFEGPWAVGAMTSRGHGRIGFARATAFKAAA